MRICIISDKHNHPLRNMNLPDADVLLHAGDWTGHGSLVEVEQFNNYCGQVKDKFKYGILCCAGNHELGVEANYTLSKSLLTNVSMLTDEAIEIEGVKFWFSPFSKWFFGWAWNLHPGKELEDKWNQIPEDTNVLITHGPPKFMLDTLPSGEAAGDLELYNRILQLENLRLHGFGHIHAAHGVKTSVSGMVYANASICTESYKATNKPLLFDYDIYSHIVTQVL